MISELDLIYGKPIPLIEGVAVRPFLLKDIVNFGEKKFNSGLAIVTLDKERMMETLDSREISKEDSENLEKIDDYVFFLIAITQDEDLKALALETYSFLLDREVLFDSEKGLYFLGKDDKLIIFNNELYSKIGLIVKTQNGLLSMEELEMEMRINDPNVEPEIRELLIRSRNYNKKIQKHKAKQSDSEAPSLAEMIISISAKGDGVDIFNVWNLPYYTFIQLYGKVLQIEDYDMSVRSALAGAEVKNLTHWTKKTY